MSDLALRFEPTDLANWLWLAVAVLILLELARYIGFGHWPTSRPLRGGLAAAIFVVLVAVRLSDRFRFDASTHTRACLALAILMAVWVMRGYAQTTRGIPGRSHRLLFALRVSAVGIALLIAANPVLQRTSTTYERPVLCLAVDDSRSMSIRDVVGPDSKPISRCDAVKVAIARIKPVLGELASTLDVRWFTFSTRATPADPPSLKADGSGTAIGDSIREVRTVLSQTQRPVAGILVISDGRDTASTDSRPETSAADTAAAGIPLYTVGVGSETPINRAHSLLARRLDVPERVAVRNRLPVRSEFLAVGLTGSSIEFELLLDGKTIEKRAVEPQQATDLLRVDLNCTPTEVGLHRLTVRARTHETREPVEISRFVQITDDKIQVLYIDRPRYERAAITRALGSAEDLRVTRTDLNASGNGRSSPLPKTMEEWRRFHVILIGDIEAKAFGSAELKGLAEAVRNGAGLAMLGGLRSLGGSDYARTTLRDLLPVDLGVTGQLNGAQKIELTPAGRSNPICRLEGDPAANEKRWKQLPPFEGAGMLDKPTPASEILAQTATGQPLLVVREAGSGRTAAVAFDSTWQWAFADDHGIETQKRFWRQLVMWLANRKPDIWVTTDRQEYELGELQTDRQHVRVRAGFSDPSGRTPVAGTTLSVEIEGPGHKHETIKLAADGKEFSGEARPLAAGDYRVRALARSGEKALGESQTAFVVTAVDRELADPLPDLPLLRRMAAETQYLGGTYVPLSDLPALLSNIAAAAHPTEIRHIRRWNLVDDHPWTWYLAFLAILATEWVARRRKGLV